MAYRPRKKQPSPLATLILWGCAIAIIVWGIVQANLIYRNISTEAATQASATESATQAADDTQPAPDLTLKSTVQEITGILGTDAPDDLGPPADSQPADSQRLEAGPTFLEKTPAAELLAQGKHLLESGQIVQARYALNAALERAADEPLRQSARDLLSSINRPIFFENAVLPDDPAARMVQIQEGDTFLKLAKEFGIPAAFLESINPTLNPKNLRPGIGLKIVQGPFRAIVYKQAARLDLYARELYVCTLPVDFPEGNSLPRGEYRVTPGTKLQLAKTADKTWIGFEGLDRNTQSVTAGWVYASAGPRGTSSRDRATGIHLADADLLQLYNVLSEGKSHLRVEP